MKPAAQFKDSRIFGRFYRMYILGISAYYHDSAAALIKDGQILAAVQEERFSRKKHDDGFPHNAVEYCLDYAGLTLDELDAVVFYDKPMLKFERLLETYYGFSPKGLASFIKAMPVWSKEKLFLKDMLHKEFKKLGKYDKRKMKLLFPEHHLSHAASAFYPSPFEEAAVLTIDGVGEWATASICHGKGKDLTILKELHFPHSVGLLYSAFTYYLGFRVNSGEYKLMGLAPYGNPNYEQTTQFEEIIKTKLCKVYDDGSVWLDQSYFNYAAGLRMAKDKKWEQLFGFKRRAAGDDIEQHHSNLALAIQRVTEEAVLKMAKHTQELTGCKNLCLAGGVALNCVANGKLVREGIIENVWLQPAAGDAGGALGAALAAYHLHYEQERSPQKPDNMQGSYLGYEITPSEIERTNRRLKAVAKLYADEQQLYKEVANQITQGKVVGWVQGRMEWGPRALGNRSIIGDPRNEEMQKKLNLKIKYRESFRPFAPMVLEEDAQEYFELEGDSPYMLLVAPLKQSRWVTLPENYHQLNLRDKLYYKRSDVPAITHIDFSARIQTVSKNSNPRLHGLLSSFKAITGYGMLINTSFNVRGEPIVMTPEDAYRCFMRTEMDILVIGNYLYYKEEQPNWDKTDNWQQEFVLD